MVDGNGRDPRGVPGGRSFAIADGRWEVLADDTVQYVRPSGEIVRPAVVAASTSRGSPAWRRVS